MGCCTAAKTVIFQNEEAVHWFTTSKFSINGQLVLRMASVYKIRIYLDVELECKLKFLPCLMVNTVTINYVSCTSVCNCRLATLKTPITIEKI